MSEIKAQKTDRKAIVNDFFELISNTKASVTLEGMHFAFPPSNMTFSELDQYKQAAITLLTSGNPYSEETKKELLRSIDMTELQLLAFNSYNARVGVASTNVQGQEQAKPKRKYNTEKKQQQLAAARELITAGKNDVEVTQETGLKTKRVATLRSKMEKEKKKLQVDSHPPMKH